MNPESFFRSLELRIRKPGVFKVLATVAIAFIALASSLRAQFVYVTSYVDNTLSGYSIATNGVLTPVPGSPYSVGTRPSTVAVYQNKFVYVVLGSDTSNIGGYTIAPDGALSPIPGSPFSNPSFPTSLTVDPAGPFLFAPTIYNTPVYSIGSNGALTSVSGSPFAPTPDGNLTFNPSGTLAFSAENPKIEIYQIASNGAITTIGNYPTKPRMIPVSIAVGPSGQFLYVASRSHNPPVNFVSAFKITSTSALKPIGFLHKEEGAFPGKIAVDPNSKFLFAPNTSENTVAGYTIESNGELKLVPKSPFATGKTPLASAIDPTGKFLYVINYGASTISGYSIGSTGALTKIPGSPFATGTSPESMAITSP
jgi:6-phosphogluconolactonase